MKKLIIKAASRTGEIFGKGKSSTDPVSKEGPFEVFADLKSDVGNNSFEEKNTEYSRMFFLDAMNQYECRMNSDFVTK
jgi:hypothetical protein